MLVIIIKIKKMKKYIQRVIAELKFIYPSGEIKVINGFLGIKTESENLIHTTYLGNAYFEIDGIIYTDYNGDHKKLLKIN